MKHEWKFGRTRNAVGTRAAGECFHSFFEFSQTFLSVSITRQKQGEHVFYFFQKTPRRKIEKQLVYFDHQMKILFAHAIITSTACASSVFPSSYKNTIFNQSARVFSQGCFLNSYKVYSYKEKKEFVQCDRPGECSSEKNCCW